MNQALDQPDLAALVREHIDRWRSGAAPDTDALLDEYPALRDAKSLVLDLLLEEYCLRTKAGDPIVKSTFCDRFPAYSRSIARMLEVHEFLDQCPQFVADIERAQWPLLGESFMGFDIVEPLGQGALARVYLAREPALGNRLVVLKVSRFGAREAATLGKLSHPCIVPVYSVQHDQISGWTAICMPLLGTATAADLLDAAFAGDKPPKEASIIGRVAQTARPTLAQSANERPASASWRGPYPDAVARMGCELAEGLEAAHAHGVMHRDIKPSNILLAWSGRPMLLDFNLSTDDSRTNQRIGGTLAYMAPEVIASLQRDRGASVQHFDPRSDIYSLGAVLYELLTGHLPARPASAERLPLDAYQPWLESKQSPPKPPRSYSPAIDPRLESILLKCLAADPQRRYATAADLACELKAHLGLPATTVRFVNRNRRSVLGACLFAALAVSAIIYFIATRPPYHERLLQSGLGQYDQGQYEEAAETFTRCLELKPGWPPAHFARAQALRQQKQWLDARADFIQLKDVNPAWAYALAGYCALSSGDNDGANRDFGAAYNAGNKDIGVLLNYARVLKRKNLPGLAIKHCTEVLSIENNNADAVRCRAEAHMSGAMQANKLPSPTGFQDARLDAELNCDSFQGAFRAAVFFGYASTKDPNYRDEGAAYLTKALQRGLTRELIASREPVLLPLLPLIDPALLAAAPSQTPTERYVNFPIHPPPTAANWDHFLAQCRSVSN
jgi:serine/threonine protein kinase